MVFKKSGAGGYAHSFKPQYVSLEHIDRTKRMMLALPVPLVSPGHVRLPFGYTADPDRKGWLIPVDKEFEVLVQAKKYMSDTSLRDLADWVTHHTGREISHVGLRKLFMVRWPDDRCMLPIEERWKLYNNPTDFENISVAEIGRRARKHGRNTPSTKKQK